MKNCGALKLIRTGALGMSLAFVTLAAVPAYAQNDNTGGGTTTTTRDNRNDNRDDRRENRTERDDDRDWGWLGLLGLAGLLGLMPRKRVPVVVNETRDRDTRNQDTRDNTRR